MIEEKTMTVYKTSDGNEFLTREQAELNEERLSELPKIEAFCSTFKKGMARTRVKNILCSYNAFEIGDEKE